MGSGVPWAPGQALIQPEMHRECRGTRRGRRASPAEPTGPAASVVVRGLLHRDDRDCSRQANNKWTQRRPPTFRAAGIVTCDGVAIDNALVSLDSLEHNLTAVGRTDTKGGFTLKTFEPGDGATSGEHRVRITKIEVTAYDKDGTPLGHVNRLPERYADESGKLRATVEPKHGNVFRFDLTSGKPSAQ